MSFFKSKFRSQVPPLSLHHTLNGLLIRAPELNPEQKEVVVAPAQMRIVSTSNLQGCPVFQAIPIFLTVNQIEEIYENPANYSTIRFPVVSPITTPAEGLAPALSDYIVKLVDYYRLKRPDDDGYTSAQNLLSVLTMGIEETLLEAQPFGDVLCAGVHPEISDDLLSRLDGMLYLFPYSDIPSAFEILVYIAEPHGCSRSIIFPWDPEASARRPGIYYRSSYVSPINSEYDISLSSGSSLFSSVFEL